MVISQLQREVLLSIKGLYMKVTTTLADSVVKSLNQINLLMNIKGLCMKEINTLPDNVVIIFYPIVPNDKH